MTINDLTVDISGVDRESLLSSWNWLLDEPVMPVLVTALGDVFVANQKEHVFFLAAEEARIDRVADSVQELRQLLTDSEFVTAFFFPQIVEAKIASGERLDPGQCFSLDHPLVLGGDDAVDQYKVTDIQVHLGNLGQIHEQVRDLLPGTPIENITIE